METVDSQLLYNLIILSALTLPLKGWALWRAARHEQKWWFFGFMILNSLGIIELVYLFYFSDPKSKSQKD